MKLRGRKSIRLKGYDYARAGEYFVTICTKDRVCAFGKVIDGVMTLSKTGEIVEACWNEIPAHFENARTKTHQVMPNHFHGIVEIREKRGVYFGEDGKTKTKRPRLDVAAANVDPPRRDVACNVSTGGITEEERHNFFSTISPKPGSLNALVRSFKSAVTKKLHEEGILRRGSVWQGRFHDHIIRNRFERFFIDRYIRLNPLLWLLDSDNPAIHEIPIDDLGRLLKEKYAVEESEVEYLVRHEIHYRKWKEKEAMRLQM